jgi:hypothetical protein
LPRGCPNRHSPPVFFGKGRLAGPRSGKQRLAAYVNAYAHPDPANLDTMEALIDELLRERCRAMGLAEGEEICRIELELAAAANDELAEEIREFRRRVQEARRKVATQNVVVQKLFVDAVLEPERHVRRHRKLP